MTTIEGVYRAVCLAVTDDRVRCKVPQLFADETVTCFDIAGGRPAEGAEGFVAFEGGWPDRPVWIGSQWELAAAEVPNEVWIGDEAPDPPTELWFDTTTSTLKVYVEDEWVLVSAGGGGAGTDEVWIGTTDPRPTNPTIELWYDADEGDARDPNLARWNSAWGVIGQGSFLTHPITLTANVAVLTTNPLVVTLIAGRRYRVTYFIRTIYASSGNCYYRTNLRIGGANVAAVHPVSLGMSGWYNDLHVQWLLTGDGTSKSLDVTVTSEPVVSTASVDALALFYVEDVGPVTYGLPPAVDPTPPAVAKLPQGLLAHTQLTADVTATTDIAGLVTAAVTTDGTRRFKVTIDGYGVNQTSGTNGELNICQGSTSIKRAIVSRSVVPSPYPVHVEHIYTPAAGTYTYKGTVTGGPSLTFYAGATYPLFIAVEDIGGV